MAIAIVTPLRDDRSFVVEINLWHFGLLMGQVELKLSGDYSFNKNNTP